MTHPSKRKGNDFEREVVNRAKEHGLDAVRSYASDGRSRGMAPTVDITIQDLRFQLKRRKKIAKYLEELEGTDGQIMRGDGGETIVIITLDTLFMLMNGDGND